MHGVAQPCTDQAVIEVLLKHCPGSTWQGLPRAPRKIYFGSHKRSATRLVCSQIPSLLDQVKSVSRSMAPRTVCVLLLAVLIVSSVVAGEPPYLLWYLLALLAQAQDILKIA